MPIPKPVGYVAVDIDEFRMRSRMIGQLLAENAIPNGTTTHLCLIHIIVSSWMAEDLTEEAMALNLASLLNVAMELAGARLSPEERTSHLYKVAEKH